MAQSVSVFRFEYEILPNMNPWNVFIAAFSHEEAQLHLQKIVAKPIRITSSTMVCRLDDLSNGIRNNVVQAFLNSKGTNEAAGAGETSVEKAKDQKESRRSTQHIVRKTV